PSLQMLAVSPIRLRFAPRPEPPRHTARARPAPSPAPGPSGPPLPHAMEREPVSERPHADQGHMQPHREDAGGDDAGQDGGRIAGPARRRVGPALGAVAATRYGEVGDRPG